MDHLYLIDEATTILACKFFHHPDIRKDLPELLQRIKKSSVNKLFVQVHTLTETYGDLGTVAGNKKLLGKYGFMVVDEDLKNKEYPILEFRKR